MEIIISLVFMGLFNLLGFLPFIIIIIVIIKGVKNGKVRIVSRYLDQEKILE